MKLRGLRSKFENTALQVKSCDFGRSVGANAVTNTNVSAGKGGGNLDHAEYFIINH